MKKHLYINCLVVAILFLFVENKAIAQVSIKDLSSRMCDCFKQNQSGDEAARVAKCRQIIHNDLEDLTKQQRDKAVSKMLIDLSKNCAEYIQMHIINSKKNDGNWEILDEMPPSALKNSECFRLENLKNLHYVQANGDTVNVSIENVYWKETSRHGEYVTILKFKWLKDCDFELIQEKTNNPIDGKYYKKGEKLEYRILEKQDTYYSIAVTNGKVVEKFKLYY